MVSGLKSASLVQLIGVPDQTPFSRQVREVLPPVRRKPSAHAWRHSLPVPGFRGQLPAGIALGGGMSKEQVWSVISRKKNIIFICNKKQSWICFLLLNWFNSIGNQKSRFYSLLIFPLALGRAVPLGPISFILMHFREQFSRMIVWRPYFGSTTAYCFKYMATDTTNQVNPFPLPRQPRDRH